jgi:hypothetical protein
VEEMTTLTLQKKHAEATKAWGTLRDILELEYSEVVRDAAIQRFEYTTGVSIHQLHACNEDLHSSDHVIRNPKAVFV